MKEYYINNKEKMIASMKNAHLNNPEKRKLRAKKYRENNKEKVTQQKKSDYSRNKEKSIARSARWYQNNKEHTKNLGKKHNQENKDKVLKYKRDFAKNQCDESIDHRIRRNLRARLRSAIKNKCKKGSAVRDLGCSILDLIAYLENKFYNNMTWDNYGKGRDKWQVDHIIPLSKFNLEDKEEFLKATHYTNLQPLWFNEHSVKSAKERWPENE